MNRKQFIRNTLLSFASILLPEVLRPMDGEIKQEMVDVQVGFYEFGNFNPDGSMCYRYGGTTTWTLPKEQVEVFDGGFTLKLSNLPHQKTS